MENVITSSQEIDVKAFRSITDKVLESMEIKVDTTKFMDEVFTKNKTFKPNPLTNGMLEMFVSTVFLDDSKGKYITERQTIEKLSLITSDQVVYEAIFTNDYSTLKLELEKYDVNFDTIVEKLNKLKEQDNTEKNLAAQIELELLYGFQKKLEKNENIDVEKYKNNLFTKKVSTKNENIISTEYENTIGYENLDKTEDEFKRICKDFVNSKNTNKTENGYNRN